MKLKDIIEEHISGDWGEESPTVESPCDVYCVRGADIVAISSDFFENIPLRFISPKAKSNKTLQNGDLVIEKSGGSPTQSTGRVVYISDALIQAKGDVVCSNFCTAIRIKDGWNPKFVYYYWKFIYDAGVFFNFEGKTSGLKNLQFDNVLTSIDIPEYPLSQQNQIAEILSRIEAKISINREINRNLEAMARQLYDYWFVQFDFPDENGRPYKSSGGKMVWNEKLRTYVPDEWESTTISSISDTNHRNLSKKDPLEKIMYLDTRNLTENSISELQSVKRNNAPSRAQRIVSPKTILYSTVRPRLKHYGIIFKPEKNLIASTGFCSINAKDDISPSWLYLYITEEKITAKLGDIADTAVSSYPSINPNDIEQLYVINPPKRLAIEFEKKVGLLFEMKEENETQIKTMQKKRDELLPLLMNGQVSVTPPEVNCDLSHD